VTQALVIDEEIRYSTLRTFNRDHVK